VRRGSAEHNTGPLTCRFANAPRSPDEAFNRWEVPWPDLNGRLSVPETAALSLPPGGDGLDQLRGWTAPRDIFDLELAHLEVFSARRSGHFGQPWGSPLTTPFRQAGTERAEALLPLLRQAIQDGRPDHRPVPDEAIKSALRLERNPSWSLAIALAANAGLREGEIARPRWADVNFTEEGREAGHYRQGTRVTVGAIHGSPGARRWPVSTSCTRTPGTWSSTTSTAGV
jgi:hypothetical protein